LPAGGRGTLAASKGWKDNAWPCTEISRVGEPWVDQGPGKGVWALELSQQKGKKNWKSVCNEKGKKKRGRTGGTEERKV